MPSLVSAVPAADSASALAHFEAGLAYETDCWDVHASLTRGADFVLIDVRSEELYARGHVPGALHIPHGKIIAARLAHYPSETLFVVYCSGPHCNGAQRGAIRLARLGRPVKIMIGGMSGWLAEGFGIERNDARALAAG
jgi:rhodanese-related sulfurtransferase